MRWTWAASVAIAAALLAWIAIGRDGSFIPLDKSCKIAKDPEIGVISNKQVSLSMPPQTEWRPRGGKIQFTLQSTMIKLNDAKVSVCFGWQMTGDPAEASVRSPQVDLISATDSEAAFTAVVPDLPSIPNRWPNRLWTADTKKNPYHYFSSGLVPIATVRVYAEGGELQPPLDTWREVGITSIWSARASAVAAALLAFAMLSLAAKARGVAGRGRPLLGIISTSDGYASLSQFQLLTWSFVVGTGAVYVLTLSGGLIDVPNQMLILLGITGITSLGARIPGAADKPDTPKLADPTTDDVGGVAIVAPSPDSLGVSWNAARSRKYDVQYSADNGATWVLFAHGVVAEWCRITGLQPGHDYQVQIRSTGLPGGGAGGWSMAAQGSTLLAAREPRWSDLVVADTSCEIEPTRVQMLFFTLIAASFVSVRLFNSYEIPEVPDGFLWLMGLSNGVYLSAKFVPS